ncbi:DUF2970 domain-containing protein [Shewanella oncorhynchi]
MTLERSTDPSENRKKDFQTSSPLPYIVMGIVLAVILVASLMFLVGQVLS